MAEHHIALNWERGAAPFTYDAYPRNHAITFKSGAPVIFSASPAYKGDADKGDPEDMLLAALSSCHMLSFLAIAARKKVTVDSYQDDAVGFLDNDGGKWWLARVTLRPLVKSDADSALLAEIHHLAHEACFIANSVKAMVTVEPR
jgi:organic hydroperoxide reductase OsmC/OhrA